MFDKRVRGKHTQALGSSTLQQVVDSGTDNDALAAGVDGEATDLDTVTASNVLDQRGLANDLDELLSGVAVLVEVADVTGGHLLLQRDADGVLCRLLAIARLSRRRAICQNLRRYPGTTQQHEG